MKLFRVLLNSRAYSLCQRIQMQLFSTETTRTSFAGNKSVSWTLFRRISPLGDPKLTVVPVLDRWIREGNFANKSEVQGVIKELMAVKRFKHALEVSLWMTDKRRFPVSPFDIAMRLKLILKVFGLEQAEEYFNKIPENMRTYQIYLALLNCYTVAKSVDKAESIMQEARDLGYAVNATWYNLMMNLHFQLGNREKLGELLMEMEAKGIPYDQFTYSVCLSACAMASDAVGVEKVMKIMESDPVDLVQWKTWVIAAESYLRIGLIDKALVILNKLEEQFKITSQKKNVRLSHFLLKLYAEAGKKDELYRLWKVCKGKGKVVNKFYICMMRSLMIFDDIEGTEKIFEEWESSASSFDFRIPNVLIDAYCRDGHLEKAEALITRVISKGGKPFVMTWCHMAGGYLKKNQVAESMESLKKAIVVCPPRFMSHKDSLITCLEYLENRDCMGKAEELLNSIRIRGMLTEAASDDLRVFG